jgi:hypothetical protein
MILRGTAAYKGKINMSIAFCDLHAPMKEPAGMHVDKWFVVARAQVGGYALTVNDEDGPVLEKINMVEEDDAKFYFETELDAHRVAYEFYDKHGKPYPYHSRWAEVRRQAGLENPNHTENSVQSQVMNF